MPGMSMPGMPMPMGPVIPQEEENKSCSGRTCACAFVSILILLVFVVVGGGFLLYYVYQESIPAWFPDFMKRNLEQEKVKAEQSAQLLSDVHALKQEADDQHTKIAEEENLTWFQRGWRHVTANKWCYIGVAALLTYVIVAPEYCYGSYANLTKDSDADHLRIAALEKQLKEATDGNSEANLATRKELEDLKASQTTKFQDLEASQAKKLDQLSTQLTSDTTITAENVKFLKDQIDEANQNVTKFSHAAGGANDELKVKLEEKIAKAQETLNTAIDQSAIKLTAEFDGKLGALDIEKLRVTNSGLATKIETLVSKADSTNLKVTEISGEVASIKEQLAKYPGEFATIRDAVTQLDERMEILEIAAMPEPPSTAPSGK